MNAVILAGVSIGCASASAAETTPSPAKFETRMIKQTMEATASEIVLSYPFENIADYPIVVDKFEESCGCMSGRWDGVEVPPGGKGEIKAVFIAKGLRGKVTKSLRVNFVGGGKVELAAQVDIAEVLGFSERTLSWAVNASPEPKTVDLTINSKEPIKVTELRPGSGVVAELSEVEVGRRYQIKVYPKNTGSVQQHVIQVRTDSKDPRDAIQAIFVLVEAEKPVTHSKGGKP